MLIKLKNRFINWLLKDTHLGELHIGERSIIISGTGANLDGQKIENVGAPDSDDDVPRRDTIDTKITTHTDNASAHHVKTDIFDKFRDFIPWVCLDAFTTGGDSGFAVNAQGDRLQVEPGNQVNYDAWIRSTQEFLRLLVVGTKISIEIPIVNLDGISSQNVWIRFAQTYTDPPSETDRHFGWKIIGADLYASNADGATQKITDTGVDLVAGPQTTRLKVVTDRGVDLKFYVNEVLKATHTENLPDVLNLYFHTHVRVLAPTYRTTYLGRILIEK